MTVFGVLALDYGRDAAEAFYDDLHSDMTAADELRDRLDDHAPAAMGAIAEREFKVQGREANPHGETHVTCSVCAPDRRVAYCGAQLRGVRHPPGTPPTCMVCAAMKWANCPRCGSW